MDAPQKQAKSPQEDAQPESGYDYVRQIGRGGYGYVYLFRQTNGGYCAGKFVYRHLLPTEENGRSAAYDRAFEGLQRFQSLSGQSDYLLRILHVRQRDDEGYFCYMMELADDVHAGRAVDETAYQPKTLKSEIDGGGRRQRIAASRCLDIAISLARGLQVLHENGLVHRDVRPSNIIFVNGLPKLADIDLVAGQDATLTSYIPREYAAPEGAHSARADIFSFGKTLYEMCTGQPVEKWPRLPVGIRDWEDHKTVLKINRVISRACARKLRSRYSSARELIKDLDRIKGGKSPGPHPAPLGIPIPFLLVAGLAAVCLISFAPRFWRAETTIRAPGFAVTPGDTKDVNLTSPISLVTVPPASSRAPVPPVHELALAREWEKTNSSGPVAGSTARERAEYATSLLNKSPESETPAQTLARLELARDFAAEAGDHETALRACDQIGNTFAVPMFELNSARAKVLAVAARATSSSSSHSQISTASSLLGFRCLAMDDYFAAIPLAQTAVSSAEISGVALQKYEASFLGEEVERGSAPYEHVKIFAGQLRKHPQDAKANLECGKYLCFIKNDWLRGLPMLEKGSDSGLKEVARKETASSTAEQHGVGDGWWLLANSASKDSRSWYFQRAAYWYAKALSTETNSTAINQMKDRREQFLREWPPTRHTLVIGINVEGGASIVITPDEIRLKNSHGVRNVRINLWQWGTFRRGGPEILRNCGETRFLPGGVDLAKGTITKRMISRRWGKIDKFEPSADRVDMYLSDPPAGSSDFELEISF